jgi:hypothetical protein
MSGTIGYDELRAATVRQVAQLTAAAAITAPKSGARVNQHQAGPRMRSISRVTA